MTTYIAIDPGERWIGVALWNVQKRKVRAWTIEWKEGVGIGTIAGAFQAMFQTHRPACVAIESYQVRPQAHNAFSEAKTIKLIGALEAVCEMWQHPHILVRADSESKAVFYWPDQQFWDDKHQQSAARILGVLLQEKGEKK